MTTITLDVPDDLATKLRQFQPSILVEILRKVLEFLDLLTLKQPDNLVMRQSKIEALEKKHREGYQRYPQQPDEINIWLDEQVWEEA